MQQSTLVFHRITHKYETSLKLIGMYKHSSLFHLFVSDEKETFYNVDAIYLFSLSLTLRTES
jgi:hypothetical protein